MALFNVMEELVNRKMGEMLSVTDCCKCEQCVEDMKALALNRLPSKYVSSNKGELFSRLNSVMNSQNSIDIEIAVANAIKFVADHPRHEKKSG